MRDAHRQLFFAQLIGKNVLLAFLANWWDGPTLRADVVAAFINLYDALGDLRGDRSVRERGARQTRDE
jgi:hypothetical protein